MFDPILYLKIKHFSRDKKLSVEKITKHMNRIHVPIHINL